MRKLGFLAAALLCGGLWFAPQYSSRTTAPFSGCTALAQGNPNGCTDCIKDSCQPVDPKAPIKVRKPYPVARMCVDASLTSTVKTVHQCRGPIERTPIEIYKKVGKKLVLVKKCTISKCKSTISFGGC